jgi:hypothetical protein
VISAARLRLALIAECSCELSENPCAFGRANLVKGHVSA